MRIHLRAITHPSPNQWGNGRNTQPSEKRKVLTGGYRVVVPSDAGEMAQMSRYDVMIETPEGWRYALKVVLEEGDE